MTEAVGSSSASRVLSEKFADNKASRANNRLQRSCISVIRSINLLQPRLSKVAWRSQLMCASLAEPRPHFHYECETVHVRFELQRECLFGDQFLLVGDDPILGAWEPSNAIPLQWSDGHLWSVEIDLPVGKLFKFKLLMETITGQNHWQPGHDRKLQTWRTRKTILVVEDWESPEFQRVLEREAFDYSCDQHSQSLDISSIAIDGVKVEESIAVDGHPVIVSGLPPLPTQLTEQKDDCISDQIVPDDDLETAEVNKNSLKRGAAVGGFGEKMCINGEATQEYIQSHAEDTVPKYYDGRRSDIKWGQMTLKKILTSLGLI